MTVSKTTTQEKAREFHKARAGKTYSDSEEYVADIAGFADSLTAELQKENARLREALGKIGRVVKGQSMSDARWIESVVMAALSKEKK